MSTGEKILTAGFCIYDAHKRGVGIEECPVEEREMFYQTMLDYNIEQSTKDALLNGQYEETDDVQYGLGDHNHLLNFVRGVIKRLPWQLNINEIYNMRTPLVEISRTNRSPGNE